MTRSKLICTAISGIFFLFALAQYNDPDPYYWALLYGGIAALYAFAARGIRYRPAIWLWLLVSLVWMLFLLPGFIEWARMGFPSIVETMQAEKPWVELTREFLGLLLSVIACGYLLYPRRA